MGRMYLASGGERWSHADRDSLRADDVAAGRCRVNALRPSDGDPRGVLLATALKKARYRADALIDVLHAVQDIYGHLTIASLREVAHALRLPPSRVIGVATFYHLFTFEARGEHTCTVCTGTACFVKGADALMTAVVDAYHVTAGSTTEDGALSLLEARCLGSCGLAPVALIDGAVVARASPATLRDRLEAVVASGQRGGA